MKKNNCFNQIVCLDNAGLTNDTLVKLQQYSNKSVKIYDDYPSGSEIISRIRFADCVLLSWNTRLTSKIINASKNLKYIGLCCSLYSDASSNVDMKATKTRNIIVKGVSDYGDNGVVEFIIAQMICLYKGLPPYMGNGIVKELTNKTLGIVGFGKVGQMVADAAIYFGMKVKYYNRTRYEKLEDATLQYASLAELLSDSDVITLHLPKHTKLLSTQEFSLIKAHATLINTSLYP